MTADAEGRPCGGRRHDRRRRRRGGAGGLVETQGAAQPLVPYFNTLGGRFIAVALAGIAVAITRALTIGTASGNSRGTVRSEKAGLGISFASD